MLNYAIILQYGGVFVDLLCVQFALEFLEGDDEFEKIGFPEGLGVWKPLLVGDLARKNVKARILRNPLIL